MIGEILMRKTTAEIAQDLTLSRNPTARFSDFNEMHKALVFFQKSHFDQYVPTLGSQDQDYGARLEGWLENVGDDAARALLMELATRIVFLSREDMAKLNESAMRGPITRWIIDKSGLALEDLQFDSTLRDEIENHTWYTSITDSMQISSFHHVNHLGGTDLRPDWKSLAELGSTAKIRNYMETNKDTHGVSKPLKRIVILEDFVGSGAQMQMGSGSVEFAAMEFPDKEILLCPLICCPRGAEAARALCASYSNVRFDPVIEIEQHDLLSPFSNHDVGSFDRDVVDFCSAYHVQVVGDGSEAPRPYTPWGLLQTGCVIVMYSNAPANTLPLIQHQSNSWNALFPRSARIR